MRGNPIQTHILSVRIIPNADADIIYAALCQSLEHILFLSVKVVIPDTAGFQSGHTGGIHGRPG